MQTNTNNSIRKEPGGARNIAARAGRWSARHRKTAVIGWLVFVVAAFIVGGNVGQKTIEPSEAQSGESGRSIKAIEDAGLTPPAGETVFIQSTKQRFGDKAFDAAVADAVKSVGAIDVVRNLKSPLDGEAEVSKDGHAVLVQFEIAGDADDAEDKIDPVVAAIARVQDRHPSLTIDSFGGASVNKALNEAFNTDLARARNLSLPITLLILLLAFGAIVAAGVPVLLAISAVMATLGLVALPSQLIPVDEAIAEVIVLIGMAVGVDYSLFYLKRQREERAAGRDTTAAIEAAAATSGRAVLISGVTVMAAMAGMFLTGDKTFISFGIGTIMVVAIAMIGSLTVLPAMLSMLGDKVDRGRIPFLGRRRARRDASGEIGGVWAGIVDVVLRRPVVSAVLATAVLAALAVPAFSLKTQVTTVDDFPQDLAPIQTYNKIQKSFPSKGSAADVVLHGVNVKSPAARAAIADFGRRTATTAGMYAPDEINYSMDGRTAEIVVPLAETHSGAESDAQITQLRDQLIPATIGALPGAKVDVGGDAAGSKDFNDLMGARAPYVFAFVLSLAFILLLMTFRSIVIPIKAIALNLLSVAAAYGVLVLVFQHGWGESLLGFEANGAVTSWIPMFLFVILFGLSMDYHVFILTRVREAFDRGMSTDEAVAYGIKSTAGVVTSAAIVMVGVFSIFGSLSMLPMKQMGVGLASAILIDATIIRAVLLPATMKLLGDWNWYMPKSLGWVPSVSVERPVTPVAEVAKA